MQTRGAMNIALCRQGVMNGLTAVLILTCMQETYLLLAEHNKFAGEPDG